MSASILTPARRSRRASYRLLAAVYASALAACGGSSDGPGAPAERPPTTVTLGITAASAIVTVQQGQSAAATVTIVRGGYSTTSH